LSKTNIEAFFEAYIKTKKGALTLENKIMHITYPDRPQEKYTYCPTVGRENNALLIASGSPTFQHILQECQKNGVLCQIQLSPQKDLETNIKHNFKDDEFVCIDCDKVTVDQKEVSICVKPQSCYHQVNCGKILKINIGKQEPVRYFQFYYTVALSNKLRSKSEEILTVLLDEKADFIEVTNFDDTPSLILDETLTVSEGKGKVKPELFDQLKAAADKTLESLLCGKVALFDLPISSEKKAKLQAFEKRLKQERREQILSRKRDFDPLKWQNNYQTLLQQEENSYLTNVSIKLVNFLVINTSKIKFDLVLNNNAVVHSTLTLGLNQTIDVTCPVCKKTFTEGYATHDSLYVCENCVKQSADSGKIYSKKAALSFDDTLNEYIEQGSGFICTVCGKRHSNLLEFKCNHDNSSICIYHYGFCDICGNEKIYSKNNLSYTDEFKHQHCPKHTKKTNPPTN
jgi:Skp family chaperone for outer membrane proteins